MFGGERSLSRIDVLCLECPGARKSRLKETGGKVVLLPWQSMAPHMQAGKMRGMAGALSLSRTGFQ
jgi:hypothetical protein